MTDTQSMTTQELVRRTLLDEHGDFLLQPRPSMAGAVLGAWIADRRVLRLIQKWLAAGVIENGTWTASEEGVPQGASVSSPSTGARLQMH